MTPNIRKSFLYLGTLLPHWRIAHQESAGDAKIGIGVGVGLVGLLTIFLVGFMVFARRRARARNATGAGQIPQYSPPLDGKSLSSLTTQNTTQEMDVNSIKELHDVFQVELLDGSTPSGSGNRIDELPHDQIRSCVELPTFGRTPTPSAHQEDELHRPQTATSGRLSTRHTHKTSTGSSTLHSSKKSTERAIYDPLRRISKRSSRSDGTGSRSPPARRTISLSIDVNKALPKIPMSDVGEEKPGFVPSPLSTGCSGIRSPPSSLSANHSYRTRIGTRGRCPSPPSTPISESDQVSPVAMRFYRDSLVRRNSRMSRRQSLTQSPPYPNVFDCEDYNVGDGESMRSGRVREY